MKDVPQWVQVSRPQCISDNLINMLPDLQSFLNVQNRLRIELQRYQG